MHINFENIKLFGFMPFEEAEVNLKENGFTLISGINNNVEDKAQSNGAGKSSLISDSISWALTGETIRGTKDVCNKNTSLGTSVELNFSIDKYKYKVVRYKDHKDFGTNLKFYINGEDKSGKGIRDTEKILQEYLPDLNSQLLGSVIILGQGLPQRFTNNTPSGRKEVLEKLSKSDFMIADIKDKITKRKIQLQEQLRKIEDNILSDSSKKSILENNLQKLKNDKALLEQTDINIIEQDIVTTQNYIVELMKNKEIFELKQSSLQKQVDTALDNYTNFSKKLDANYDNEYNHLEEKYGISNKKILLDDLKLKIKQQENEISKLESIKDICPTCHQKLPDIHKVDTTKLHEELQSMRDKYNEYKQYFDLANEKLNEDALKLKESLYKGLDDLKEEGQQLRKQLNESIDEAQKYNKEINNSQLKVDKLKLNKENYEKQIQSIDINLKECENQLEELSKAILYYNIDKENTNNHIEVVNKMSIIANRDFRGFLLSEIISFIDKKAKEYSQIIFETDKIKFNLNGNNIDISYCDKQYENLSGGEKQRVDLIIQFSIRDMLSQFLDFSSNILILDEITDSLDEISSQQVISLISNKLCDVDSVFIITHHGKQLSIPYDKEITILKDNNGISRLI